MVLISVVLIVLSATNINSDLVRHDTFLGSFYGGVNQRFSEFSSLRNSSKTTLSGRDYDDTLCTVQFLNAMNALNRSDTWALTGELNLNKIIYAVIVLLSTEDYIRKEPYSW